MKFNGEEIWESVDHKFKKGDIDPYGEEIWESMNDKFKEGDIVRYIGQAHYIINGEGIQEKADIYGKKCEIINVRPTKWDRVLCSWCAPRYLLRIIETDKKFVTIGERLMSEEEFKKMDQKRKNKLLKYKDIDPYGEEDWDVNESNMWWLYERNGEEDWGYMKENLKINESSKNEFDGIYIKIKSRAEYDEALNYLKSVGFVWSGNDKLEKWTPKWVKNGEYGETHLCPHVEKNKKILFQTSGTFYKRIPHITSLSVSEFIENYNYFFKMEEEKRRKEEARREEMRLKMMDIDPYGEEEWENESKLKKYEEFLNETFMSSEELFPVGTIVVIENEEVGYDRFIGEIGEVIGYHSCGSVLVKFDKIYYPDSEYGEIQHDGYRGQDPTNHSRFFAIEDMKIADSEIIKEIEIKRELKRKKKEELRLRYKDIDPYGEENWDVNESLKNRDFYIKIESEEEYNRIMKFLDTMGYIWGNKMALKYFTPSWVKLNKFDHSYIHIYSDKSVYQIPSELVNVVNDIITVSDFINLKNKEKAREDEMRLKYKNIDPYGEEDWLDENIKIKTFESFKSEITELNLSHRGLTELPDLSNLTNLKLLYCSNNQLTELPDLSNLNNLKELSCSNNQLTELPDLSNLTNLKLLYCSNNQLTELPDLSHLTNLELLCCSNNQLTELPDLSHLTNLERLYCSNNQLPYNNLTEHKKWIRENKYTPEEKERIKKSKQEIDPYGEEDWLDENIFFKMRNLKTYEEFSDYRNVTGYGSMGHHDPQNSGPTFNKGPDSATFCRPNVIGVEEISMEDPYFNNRKIKNKKIRKNKYVEKTRKDKTKYLNGVDKETRSKMIKENSSIKKLRPKDKPEFMKDVYEKFEKDKKKVCDYLNEKYKDEIIRIEDTTGFLGSIMIGNFKFLPGGNSTYLIVHYNDGYTLNMESHLLGGNTHLNLINDTITIMELYIKKQVFSEEDPYGEEDWDEN